MDNNFWIMEKYAHFVPLGTKLSHLKAHGWPEDLLQTLAKYGHPDAPDFNGDLEAAADWAHTTDHQGKPRMTGIGPAFEDHPDPDLRVPAGKGHGGLPDYKEHDPNNWETDISKPDFLPARPFNPETDR